MKRPLLLLAALLLLCTSAAHAHHDHEETFTLRENGFLYSNRWGNIMWYGTPVISSGDPLPASPEEAFALLDLSQWGYLAADTQALRFFHMADGGVAMDVYREGTPVQIVRLSDDGQDAFVKICGSEVACRVPAKALVPADTQYENNEYSGWRNPQVPPSVKLPADMTPPTLHIAPEGAALCTLPADTEYRLYLLADCQEDGWFHVTEPALGVDGYVHVSELPQDDPYVQAALLLPDYLCQSGSVGEGSVGFIMTNPQGETVFVGGEQLADGSWRFTESQPLPADTECDTYHSSGGEQFIFSVLDEEATALYSEDIWTEYILRLHDGQWLLDRITSMDWMGIGESPVIYAQDVGMLYGSITFDRNAATLDWTALPDTLEELMALTAQDWAILKEDAPLRQAPGGDILYQYRIGTPVEILEKNEGWAHIAVLGGTIRGWLPVSVLAIGTEQLVTEEYISWDGEPASYQNSLMEYAPCIDIRDSATLYDAPEGHALEEDCAGPYILLSDLGNGWYHVFDGYLSGFFVRAEDCDPLSFVAASVAPAMTLMNGLLSDETAMLLLASPLNGDRFFAGCVLEDGVWRASMTAPLPDGIACRFDADTPIGAVLYFEHPALLEEAEKRNDPRYADCSFHIARQEDSTWAVEYVSAMMDYLYFEDGYVWSELGRVCWGERLFSLDITQVDWLSFPLTVAQTAAQMDTADWAVLAEEASLYDAPDGTPLARYNAAAPLLLLDRQPGWYQVAVNGGITGWIRADALLVGAEQAEGKLLCPADLPILDLSRYQRTAAVLNRPSGETLTLLDETQPHWLRILGAWEADGAWLHVYDSSIPGGDGFINLDDLVPDKEYGHG